LTPIDGDGIARQNTEVPMRACAFLVVLSSAGCSTAPVTNLFDHFAPSRYEANRDAPRKPRDRDDGPAPPGVFPAEPRDGGKRVGLGEPVPELATPFARN